MQVTSPVETSRTPQTAGRLLLAALATVFVFLLDELLGWLGWQLIQTPLLDGLALVSALLLLPVAVWWLMSQRGDWLDRGGAMLGCALGGAFLA